MKLQKKLSLTEFFETVSEDENEISKILEDGIEAAYEKADYDLFVAWSLLVNKALDNNLDQRVDYHFYKNWSGSGEITVEAYKQRLYCNCDAQENLQRFQFNNIAVNSPEDYSAVYMEMKPLVENLIKKIKDKKKNGSI